MVDQPSRSRWERFPPHSQLWILIVEVLALLVAIATLVFTIRQVQKDVGKVARDVDRIDARLTQRQFTITYPADGSTVALRDLVRGLTPYSDRNHYLVVTPVNTGDDWVQDSPLKISAGGAWTADAMFGEAAAGVGEDFIVTALATRSTLSPGPLTKVPQDVILSESIAVTRQ